MIPCQTSDTPLTIADNGTKHAWSYSLYVQDEWKLFPSLTVNYGVRYDEFDAFDSESQISPRVNVVWTPTDTTTVHAGFSRYFSPPPIELVATTDIAMFDGTTAAGRSPRRRTPRPSAPTITMSASSRSSATNSRSASTASTRPRTT